MGGCHGWSPAEYYFRCGLVETSHIQEAGTPNASTSLACQYGHQPSKYPWNRGDGALVCRYMQVLFIHQVGTWLSVPVLAQSSWWSGWYQKSFCEGCWLISLDLTVDDPVGEELVLDFLQSYSLNWNFTRMQRGPCCAVRCPSPFIRIHQCYEWKFLCVGRLLP